MSTQEVKILLQTVQIFLLGFTNISKDSFEIFKTRDKLF